MHEFGWRPDDYDLLASGSLAGHIIECGCQATGGLHTDWEDIPDWAHMGYPVVECHADGSFVVTKPEGTGGKVIRANVVEQMLYEIGDPGAYLLPDVSCDFRDVVIEQQGDEPRARRPGASGRAPTPFYKVSATQLDGFRCAGSMVIIGIDAEKKARRTAEAIIERTGEILRQHGPAALHVDRTSKCSAPNRSTARMRARGRSREVMMRVVANHPQKAALAMFAREISPVGHLVGAGHHQPRRRPARGVAADQALLVHAGQGRGAGGLRARTANATRSRSAPGDGAAAGAGHRAARLRGGRRRAGRGAA